MLETTRITKKKLYYLISKVYNWKFKHVYENLSTIQIISKMFNYSYQS